MKSFLINSPISISRPGCGPSPFKLKAFSYDIQIENFSRYRAISLINSEIFLQILSSVAKQWLEIMTCDRRNGGRWIHRSIRFEKLKEAHLHVLKPWRLAGGEPAKKPMWRRGIPRPGPPGQKSWQRWSLRGGYPGTRRMRTEEIIYPRVHGYFPSPDNSRHSCRLSFSYNQSPAKERKNVPTNCIQPNKTSDFFLWLNLLINPKFNKKVEFCVSDTTEIVKEKMKPHLKVNLIHKNTTGEL